MKLTLDSNERDCSNYFKNKSNDYIRAKSSIHTYFELQGYTVFQEIGFSEPGKRKLRGIANLLVKRKASNHEGIPIIESRAVLIFFPHKPFSTAVLIKKIQRIISNWPAVSIFLCYYTGGKRKGEFPVITQRIANKFDSVYIYSLELESKDFRTLYNPLDLNSEVILNANQNYNDKSRGSS